MCFPQSTCNGSAFLPQRLATSNHLSEKAPHMQLSTPRPTRLRIDASITPHADEVDRKTGWFVLNNFCKPGRIARLRFLKSSLRRLIIGLHDAAAVFVQSTPVP